MLSPKATERAQVCGEIISICIAAEDTIYNAHRKLKIVHAAILGVVFLGVVLTVLPLVLPELPSAVFAVGLLIILSAAVFKGVLDGPVTSGWVTSVSEAWSLMCPKANLGQRVLALVVTVDRCATRTDKFSSAMLKHKHEIAKAQSIIGGPDPYYATARTEFQDRN